jgi:glycosyltransferase involved in cell wall biosynthesis
VRDRGLDRAVVAPYQARERLDASLSCADLHLVSLLEGLEGCIVPCKLFGAMAAGRPSVFIGHPESEIARVLVESASGAIVRQGDVDGLVAIIRELARDRERAQALGERARAALRSAYDRERACERWRLLLEEVVAPEGASHRAKAVA